MNKIAERNGSKSDERIATKTSKLGQRLRRISDRAIAAGMPTLSKEQINALVRQARGGSARP
jgi:hypothetical protein